MLRVDQLRLAPDQDPSALRRKIAKLLRLQESDLLRVEVLRRAVDAREELFFVYTAAVEVKQEAAVLRRCRDRRVSPYAPEEYHLPAPCTAAVPPVVVGAGPAGLFAALVLAHAGLRPVLLERGQPTEQRIRDVESFWSGGALDTESNVQFGEGGAGAFSDGKLNTGTKDLRHRFILQQLVACGAPESILTDAKPHIGTDYLHTVLKALRQKLLALGCDIRFGHRLEGLRQEAGVLTALTVRDSAEQLYTLPCRQLVLAPGHSARDTVEALYADGLAMEAKPFAVGVRIEHRQSAVDAVQYKKFAGHPALGAATYKLSCHLPNGRSAFSFCVCPGGQVVAAASEAGRAVTNGMSEYARDRENINGALLVNVTPADFPTDHPLAGIAFQRRLEEAAFALGGGDYRAPCQRVEDFLLGRPSAGPGSVLPSYRPGVKWCDLHGCLPDFVARTLALALPELDRKLPGYAAADAVLTAVESRSSAPVRIPRGHTYQANIRGVYPCGEGAGYAGGILSAAADGMRCAEQITGGIL